MNNPWDQIVSPEKDISALRVDAEHPLDLFWAKDQAGRYLFVYEYTSKQELDLKVTPDLVGIETIFIPSASGISRLVLVLKDKINWEIFFSVCNDLLSATRCAKNSPLAVAIILRRLFRWQEFLKKSRLDILSEEKIKGLIGELIFLRDHLIPKFGAANAVKFWFGPEGAPQDFNINDCAVEVKCQSGITLPCVKIASADQLSPQLPKMYLFVVTLGKTTIDNRDAINLPLLVEDIQKLLEQESSQSLERFLDLLCDAGYYHSGKYLDFSYLLLEEQVFFITEGFPRICPDNLSAGIVKLSYSIGLAECEPFAVEMSKWELVND